MVNINEDITQENQYKHAVYDTRIIMLVELFIDQTVFQFVCCIRDELFLVLLSCAAFMMLG